MAARRRNRSMVRTAEVKGIRFAEPDDLLSVSLLQNRLNELGENTRVDLSNMRKSRWEQS